MCIRDISSASSLNLFHYKYFNYCELLFNQKDLFSILNMILNLKLFGLNLKFLFST
ncbi:hypothetical protein C0J52_17039 [Blattella germanica]|nr:hypothetical protein C0J52_17039 [Blattella germanica]